MNRTFNLLAEPPTLRALPEEPFIYLNGYVVQRIVYDLIKNYMIANTPEECGVNLGQKKYDPDPTKSQIHLDVGFNWKTQAMDKVPAIYIQRGDIEVDTPTIGQNAGWDVKESEEERLAIYTMPVKVTCIAAAPIAVVENLIEYVKQPIICFRKEIKTDFRLRDFRLKKITSPNITQESKNNFVADIIVNTAFDEGWIIKKDDLKIKTVGITIFDDLVRSCGCNISQ